MLIAVISAAPVGCHAFDLNVYADTSALASGKWVKISTEPVGGIHFVSYRDLRRWGFGSPERVSVAGYGTLTDSDVLSQADYIDDLPQVAALHADGGIYFYAAPAARIVTGSDGRVLATENPYVVRPCYFLTDTRTPKAPTEEGIADASSRPLSYIMRLMPSATASRDAHLSERISG